MNRFKIVLNVLSVLILLGLFVAPKPAYAGTNTFEICTSEYNAIPIQSHTFGYYGPYGYFTLHTDSSNNLDCKYIGSEASLNAGTYTASQVIESHWATHINCFKTSGTATWKTSDIQQTATVTITGSGAYVQCEFQNTPY